MGSNMGKYSLSKQSDYSLFYAKAGLKVHCHITYLTTALIGAPPGSLNLILPISEFLGAYDIKMHPLTVTHPHLSR
jgi:hypothetical protein